MRVIAIEHVQLAMPVGREPDARRFYEGVLGIPEQPKPAALAARGGCWFESGALKVHLGVDPDFRPAKKAHAAFLVDDIAALRAQLERAGFPTREDEPLEGFARFYADDPFGNRLEFLAPKP